MQVSFNVNFLNCVLKVAKWKEKNQDFESGKVKMKRVRYITYKKYTNTLLKMLSK